MKREIKFRGKDLNGEGWVYGSYLLTDDNENSPCISSRRIKQRHQIVQYNAGDWGMGGWAYYDVDPGTVGQYIGFKDKGGAEIYEGDKFQYRKHEGYILPDFTGEVIFLNGCFGYVATSKNMGEAFHPFSEFSELKEDFLEHIEVIGNVHDKHEQKQALIDMMRGDEEIGLYDDNPKNHGYER